jgi:hypothetical protein
MVRSVTLPVFLPEELKEKYHDIIASIRLYRAIARQMFCACAMAEIAGAKIVRDKEFIKVIPQKDEALTILKAAFKQDGKAHLYQLRSLVLDELAPTFHSFVWDSLRREVSKRWVSRDQLIPATRGYLLLQGVRDIAQFKSLGIGIPAISSNPKLTEHRLSIKWDHGIGGIDFVINRLDGQRYVIWKCLRDGEKGWRLGTSYLTEWDGKLRVTMTYECPDKKIKLDESKKLTLSFTKDETPVEFFQLFHNGKAAYVISVADAMHRIDKLYKQRMQYEVNRASDGGKRYGHRAAYKATQSTLSKISLRRTCVTTEWNHLWTRRIINFLIHANSGTLEVEKMPDSLLGRPWPWKQFVDFLKYKTDENNIELILPKK